MCKCLTHTTITQCLPLSSESANDTPAAVTPFRWRIVRADAGRRNCCRKVSCANIRNWRWQHQHIDHNDGRMHYRKTTRTSVARHPTSCASVAAAVAVMLNTVVRYDTRWYMLKSWRKIQLNFAHGTKKREKVQACVYVCLFVCLSACISKTTRQHGRDWTGWDFCETTRPVTWQFDRPVTGRLPAW